MRRLVSCLLAAAAALFSPSTGAPAQCGGSGNQILELLSTPNVPLGPGVTVTFRITGTPGDVFCMICATDREEVTIPGIGTLCVKLGSNPAILSGVIPASGFVQFSCTLPQNPALINQLLCCQTVGGNLATSSFSISNVVCVCLGAGCAGRVEGLTHVTSLSYPGPFPVTVSASAREKEASGTILGQTVVTYSPVARPNLPFSSDGIHFIEAITQLQNKLYVVSRVDATPTSRGHLPSDTYFSVGAGSVTNDAKVHTSCSKPIGVGMVFGPFLITELHDSLKGSVCANGRPEALVARYTGEDCSATRHAQSAGKVSCQGDPAMASPVFIRASDDQDPANTGAKVWFEGTVLLGGSFTIDSANAGRSSLATETWVHVFADATKTVLLQTVQFHTSCSQPLRVGDQFGSVKLTGFRSPPN